MKIIDKVCGKIGLVDSEEEKQLKEEIEQKRVWFQKTYPDDYAREVGDRDIFSYN